MSLGAWRFLWRQQRWELVILIGGTVLLSLALCFVAWQLAVTSDAIAVCAARALTQYCQGTIDWGNRLSTVAGALPQLATVVPFVTGLMLGAPLVAREIDRGTTQIAWTLSPSRVRWLADRVIPPAVLLAVALLVLGQASETVVSTVYPDGLGFINYGSHGPLLAARGLALFGIGTLVGMAVGRTLPAILVTIVVAVVVFGVIEYGRGELMRAEATWIDGAEIDAISMIYDSAYRSNTTGELITDEEAFERFPEVFGPSGDGVPPGMTVVYRAASPDRYPSFVARESAVLILVAASAIAMALATVRWRRPV